MLEFLLIGKAYVYIDSTLQVHPLHNCDLLRPKVSFMVLVR